MEAVTGIVLKETPYGETSKIMTVLTLEHGIISLIAKGARTMKSELRSVSGKLTYGTFNIYYKKDKLSTLKSVDVINPFKKIMVSIDKISFASYLLELTCQVSKHTYSEEIFNLLISALTKINEDFDPLVITNIIELKYLDFLGVMPVLDACALCGRKNNIVTLSSSRGGYICASCYTNDKMVSAKAIKLIRMFYYVDIAKISKLDVSLNVKTEINDFLDEYYERYTGLYLKSKQFLKNLNKLAIHN